MPVSPSSRTGAIERRDLCEPLQGLAHHRALADDLVEIVDRLDLFLEADIVGGQSTVELLDWAMLARSAESWLLRCSALQMMPARSRTRSCMSAGHSRTRWRLPSTSAQTLRSPIGDRHGEHR